MRPAVAAPIERPATARGGDSEVLLLREISGRLREIHSLLLPHQERPMTPHELRTKIGSFFDHVAANHGWLARHVVEGMRNVVVNELGTIADKVTGLFTGDTAAYTGAINFLRTFVQGEVDGHIPFLVRQFVNVDKAVDSVCDWLLRNQAQVHQAVAVLAPAR